MLQKSHNAALNELKQKVVLWYYRSNFTVAEWIVILGLGFWLTKKALFAIIGL